MDSGLLVTYILLAPLTGHELFNRGRTLQIGHIPPTVNRA
jgi:hypothetical protein